MLQEPSFPSTGGCAWTNLNSRDRFLTFADARKDRLVRLFKENV
jgi:hypothetical protein